jgi:hypothetical protein
MDPNKRRISKVTDVRSLADSDLGTRMLEFTLPFNNYYHMLGVTIVWSYTKSGGTKAYKTYPALRTTVDMSINTENHYYHRASYRQPYYMVMNNHNNTGVAKNDDDDIIVNAQNKPVIRVYLGDEEKALTLEKVVVRYLRLPESVTISEEELYVNEGDTSQVLELPNNLFNELVNKVVDSILERNENPRINTHIPMNQNTPPVPIELGANRT